MAQRPSLTAFVPRASTPSPLRPSVASSLPFPFSQLPINVKLTGDARRTADALRSIMEPGVRMRGPAPCPIARIAGKHRQQIELIAPGPAPLQKLLAAGRDAGILRAGTSMAIDVDPIALM